jgi:hypothetical protein
MNRTEMWRIVAEAFGTPKEKRDGYQRFLAGSGMCRALTDLSGDRAYDKLSAFHPTRSVGFWWTDVNPAVRDELRATFAGLMAAMTQEERDELVEGLYSE